jgi:arylsulfatase A-like enzyme
MTGDIRKSVLFRDPKSDAARNLSEADRLHLIALYDAEIRYLDQSLGELFEFLQSAGRFHDALVVLSADHGESFGEHGIWMHGFSLYAAEVHIPMLIKFPRQTEGERVPQPVQAIDIVPTIVEAARIPTGGIVFDGISVRRRTSESAFAFWGPWTLVQSRDWKLLQHGTAVELFRLPGDAAELHDVATEEPAVVNALRATAVGKLASIGVADREMKDLSSNAVEQLRALGYLPGER